MLPEPYSGTNGVDQPVMIIGFIEHDGAVDALVVNTEGQMGTWVLHEVKIDWRYDWRSGAWIDVGPYEESDDGTEETPDDWGPEVPGDLSDADGTDGRGEDLGEGGASGDVASGEAAGAEG